MAIWPAGRDALFQARLVDVAHGREVHVLLILEIVDVLAADQAVADKSDLDAIVGAEHALVRSGREPGGGGSQGRTSRDLHDEDCITEGHERKNLLHRNAGRGY